MGYSDGKKNRKINKKSDKNSGGDGGERAREEPKAITDERFASAQSDPRFMEAPKRRSKVEIDSRFQRLFTDRSFASSKSAIDKRGKKRENDNNSSKADSSLGHYYRLQQQQKEEDDEDEDDDVSQSGSESDESNASIEDDETSSASTAASDAESLDSEDEEDSFMEENVPEIDEETRRLAVVNLDWRHVRAVDLYVLLSSFLPKGGQITKVAVYPTEFGLQRMEEEAAHGPVGLFDDEKDEEQDNEDDEDEIDNKKLRAYELSRLRYYYAVVECDSIATADYLYKTCDGVEFERSANKLDLRFIPDSMDFKHQPRDVSTEAPAEYEGLDFQTQALQQSNIQLTWDEDEPMRSKTMKNILKSDQPAESELNDILASDESETDEDDDHADGMEDRSVKKRKRQDKYLALLKLGGGSDEENEEDNDQDMEVTFNSGLEDISKRILEKKDKKSETVWEANLRKRKEKKKARKSKYSSDDESSDTDRELGEQPDDFFVEEPSDNQVKSNKKGNSRQEITEETEASRAELELLLADDKGVYANLKGFNLKPKKRKGKKGKEIPDEGKIPTADYSDPRFSAIFANPLFALDPTDPQFKRSAAYVRQTAKKQKTGDQENVNQMDQLVDPVQTSEMHEDETNKSDKLAKRKEKHEVSAIIKSLKMKTKQVPLLSKVKAHHKHDHLRHKAKVQK